MISRRFHRVRTAVLAVTLIALAGSLAWAGDKSCSCFCQGIDSKGCLTNDGGCKSTCCCVINTKTCKFTGCCRCQIKNCCRKSECYKNCCFLQDPCCCCSSSVYNCDHCGCCRYTCCGTYSGSGGGAS
jgi:hypothetical protein